MWLKMRHASIWTSGVLVPLWILIFAVEWISGKQHDNNKGLSQTAQSNVDPYLSLLNNRMEAVKHKFSAEYIFLTAEKKDAWAIRN